MSAIESESPLRDARHDVRWRDVDINVGGERRRERRPGLFSLTSIVDAFETVSRDGDRTVVMHRGETDSELT